MSHRPGWIVAEAAVAMLGTVLTTFLVARIVGPGEVGRAALAGALVMLLQPAAAHAFTNAMVQRPVLTEADVGTVFWTSLALGCGIALPLAGLGLLAPEWLGAGVGPVLAGLALILPLNAVEGTANGLLLRRHGFRGLALRGIGAHAAGLATGLSLAIAGAGAWAIVGQQLAFFGTAAALAAAFARLTWVRAMRATTLREMAPFAIASATVGIADRSGFRLFLLLVAGGLPALAGVLQIAFRIVEVARDLPSPFVHRYGLPALSRLQASRAAFLQRLEAICLLAGLAFAPVFTGLALCAPEIQAALLGPAWTGIVLPVQVLSLALAVTAWGLPFGMAFTAAGMPVLNLALTLGGIGVTLGLAALVPQGSAAGAAAAWAAALVADVAMSCVFAARRLGFAPLRQLRLFTVALLPALATAAVLLALEGSGLLVDWPAALRLMAKVAVGATVALPFLLTLGRPAWRELTTPDQPPSGTVNLSPVILR